MKINLINDNFTDNYVENLLKARGVENVEDYFKPTAIPSVSRST
jgi:hypothetical protein